MAHLRRGEVDAHAEAREQRRVEVLAPVGRGNERGGRGGLDAVHPAQQHREHAPARLVHLARSRGGEGVELVEEEHAATEGVAAGEEQGELLLGLAEPARDERLHRRVDEGQPSLQREG